jgi:hypothetical protein
MKNNSLGTKVLMAALTLALVAYFGIQAVRYFGDPLTTTLAYNYRVEESENLSGFVVREELLLPEENSGLLQIQREEGERVSHGGTVAAVYTDQAALNRQTEIEALELQMEQIQYAKEAAKGEDAIQKLDAQIRRNLRDYRAAVAAERFRDVEKQASALRNQVLKRDYSGANTEELDARIAELQGQVKALQAQGAGAARRITAPESGLFSSVVDGYESVLTPAGLSSMLPSDLAGVKAAEGKTSHVGKLVQGKAWYYAAVVSEDTALSLQKAEQTLKQKGGTLLLRFAKGVERDMPVSVSSVGEAENGKVVLVLKGETYLSHMTLLREQSAQVIYRTVEGIRVPKEALRIVNQTEVKEDGTEKEIQVSGVYSVVGLEAGFKPVKVLHTADHFLLVEGTPAADREEQRLRAGEEIIVTARNLYDGKVVR